MSAVAPRAAAWSSMGRKAASRGLSHSSVYSVILPPITGWRPAPTLATMIAGRGGRPRAELPPRRLDHLRRPAVQLHLDLLGAALAIRTRVDSRDHDGFACLGHNDILIDVCSPCQNKHSNKGHRCHPSGYQS